MNVPRHIITMSGTKGWKRLNILQFKYGLNLVTCVPKYIQNVLDIHVEFHNTMMLSIMIHPWSEVNVLSLEVLD